MEKEILIPRNNFNKGDYEFFVLAADIGGSNAYIAVMGVKSRKQFDIILRNTLPSIEIGVLHKILNDMMFEAKEIYDIEINRCCIGAAGPVSRKRGHLDLTNLNLQINAKEILANTMLNKVILVNDFEAIGYGLDMLNFDKDAIKLKHIDEDLTGGRTQGNTLAVIGAGAGLGMSIVPYDYSKHLHIPLPSEGGHIDFAPHNSFELELIDFIKKTVQNNDRYPDLERVLSGEGMINLYRFIRSKKIYPETEITRQIDSLQGNQILNSIDINYGKDETCRKTIDIFINIYARSARTLALMSECYSGLFITGRIVLKHLNRFKEKEFMQEFAKHDKRSNVLRKVPVYIITNRDVGLYGCCNVAANFYTLGGV